MVPIEQVRFLSFGNTPLARVSAFVLDQEGFAHLDSIHVRNFNSDDFQTFRYIGEAQLPVYQVNSKIVAYIDNMTRLPYDPSNVGHQGKRLEYMTGERSHYTIGESRNIPTMGQSKILEILNFEQKYNKCVLHKEHRS